jgi:hypothetical protein
MHAILTFELAESWEESLSSEDEAPCTRYLRVQVSPRINGQPLLADGGLVFDALRVLVVGAAAAELDIYTCGCGVAGCAGIFEYCHTVVSDDSLVWRFPEVPFAASFTAGMPLELCFSRVDYAAALATLEADLEARRQACGVPVMLAPCETVDERDLFAAAGSFGEYLKTQRAQYARWRDRKGIAEPSNEAPIETH